MDNSRFLSATSVVDKVVGRVVDSSIKKLGDGKHSFGNGLYLQVRGASRAWFLRVQFQGKRRELGLGSYPAIRLTEARERAAQTRAAILRGEDPRPKPEVPRSPLLRDMWKEAVNNQRRVKAWTNAKASEQWYSTLEQYVLPVLGDKRVDEITRDDVLTILKPIWSEKASTAAKVRGRLETVLDYAKARGWRDGENPASWRGNLALFLPSRAISAPVKHHEAPTVEQVKDLIQTLWARRSSADLAIIFGCLTALRAREFVLARWDEVDEDVFTVPWERLKTAKRSRGSFRVPLSRQAIAVLDQARGRDEEVVFPGRPGFGRYLSLATPCTTMHRLTGSGATMHGVRSTFRDWCARIGIDFIVAEKCLSHATGDRTVQAYFRDDLLEQRREVMQSWADVIFPPELCVPRSS